MQPRDRYVRIDEVIWFPVADQVVIHILENDRFVVMKSTGKFLWELLDGDLSLEQLAESLCGHYEVTMEVAMKDVLEFIGKLLLFGIVKQASDQETSGDHPKIAASAS
jgi:hypothetical protein